jgi:hypothetical protein
LGRDYKNYPPRAPLAAVGDKEAVGCLSVYCSEGSLRIPIVGRDMTYDC